MKMKKTFQLQATGSAVSVVPDCNSIFQEFVVICTVFALLKVTDQLKRNSVLLRYDDLSTVKVGFHCCVEQSDFRKPCSISTGHILTL